jgi:hypothetical protein
MITRIFIQNNCELCESIEIPESINIETINIDENYDGFRPDQLPVLQIGTLNLVGPGVISIILKLMEDSQNDNYKR